MGNLNDEYGCPKCRGKRIKLGGKKGIHYRCLNCEEGRCDDDRQVVDERSGIITENTDYDEEGNLIGAGCGLTIANVDWIPIE